ncbi:MAG: phosphate acetyltransferase [Aeoliella sp.]
MDIIARSIQAAKAQHSKVVLPEGQDPRILAAARKILDDSIAQPIVLGAREQIAAVAAEAGVDLEGISTVDPRTDDKLATYARRYREGRSVEESIALRLVRKPPLFGGMMVACGDAATMVAGVKHATATVIQAGALTVGYAPGIKTASSFFLMIIPERDDTEEQVLIFADCAVSIAPTSEQLADIALASAASATSLLDTRPRVAMLSFSTRGSAVHSDVEKVAEAVRIARRRNPEMLIDGEFQADSAISPVVAAKKIKDGSEVAGRANVLIFPDLDAGNIAYTLTQYLAGAKAIGPLLQGFAKPICDLSRGASVDDIIATTAICLASSQAISCEADGLQRNGYHLYENLGVQLW